MNDLITILKADHREVKKLLTSLGESEEGPEREEMTARVEAALTLHMQIEEEILYPGGCCTKVDGCMFMHIWPLQRIRRSWSSALSRTLPRDYSL